LYSNLSGQKRLIALKPAAMTHRIDTVFADRKAPTIEDAGLRSLAAGTTLTTILEMVTEFRKSNDTTPIIIMGYCNPVHHMGYANFTKAAKEAGIDGAIIVDLPPEEDSELRKAFDVHDLALIRLRGVHPSGECNRASRQSAQSERITCGGRLWR